MATDETPGTGAPAGAGTEGATATAPPPAVAAAPEKRRTVVKAKRPYYFTPAGERVELPPESLEAQPEAVDQAQIDALGTDAAPRAPVTGSGGVGPAPIAPDQKPIYAADGRQIFLSPGAAMRVGSGGGGSPAAPPPSAPAAAAPPAPAVEAAAPATGPGPGPRGGQDAPLVLEPLAAVAGPTPEPPRTAVEPIGVSHPGRDGPSSGSLAPSEPSAPAPAATPTPPPSRVAEVPAASPPFSPSVDAVAAPPEAVSALAAAVTVAGGPAVAPADGAPRDLGEGGGSDELGRTDAANVEIRSEEIDEILSAMPGGLVRWGISAVFGTLCALAFVSWYIAYPDVVSGRIALTTPTPPVRLVARTGGAVARVFSTDGARVHAGDPLVLLQNPADYADVQALSSALDRLDPALERGGPLPELSFDRPLSLGTLQAPYSTLQQAYADYRLSRDEVFYLQKLSTARQQVADLELMRQRVQSQQALLEQQLSLAERSRDRTRMLVERGLAAPADVDRSEEEYLQKRVAVENGRATLSSNEVQLSVQRASLLDLEQRRSDEGQRGVVALRNAYHALRAAIASWKQENVLVAPVDGTVSFFRDLHENQFAAASEPLLAVVPTAAGLVGRVSLTGMGAGKVRVGQRVIIRFESYPYREYGTVEGRVRRVSQLGFQADARAAPEVTTYQVEVSLPKGLTTSYGRRLDFRQEMRGDADVVTQDMRLIERVFNKVRSTAGGG